MAKITYTNKVKTKDVNVPEINKITAENLNEIKDSVNVNVDDIQDLLVSSKLKDTKLIGSVFNITSDLTQIDPASFTVGIFEETTQTTFQTSGFIELEPKKELNYYVKFGDTLGQYFSLIRFYDENQDEIVRLQGNSASEPKTVGFYYQLNAPLKTVYIKYVAKISQPTNGLFSAPIKTLEQSIRGIVGGNGEKILWLGTSIPESCTYPEKSCENLGYSLVNNAKGSSFIIYDSNVPSTIIPSSGFSLSATVAEKESKWRQSVTNGDITEEQLTTWKTYSFENLLSPQLADSDIVVIDHGFNDRYDLPTVVAAGEDNIDWTSDDRTTFTGALLYLINVILKEKPFMKIVIGGYFQNKIDFSNWNSPAVCTVLEWSARNFNFPLLDVWNYAGMSKTYVLDSQNYISDFNTTYGTSYTNWNADSNGNITLFQVYNPDTVHPFSDLTGAANKRLDSVFTKLLKDSI